MHMRKTKSDYFYSPVFRIQIEERVDFVVVFPIPNCDGFLVSDGEQRFKRMEL